MDSIYDYIMYKCILIFFISETNNIFLSSYKTHINIILLLADAGEHICRYFDKINNTLFGCTYC